MGGVLRAFCHFGPLRGGQIATEIPVEDEVEHYMLPGVEDIGAEVTPKIRLLQNGTQGVPSAVDSAG